MACSNDIEPLQIPWKNVSITPDGFTVARHCCRDWKSASIFQFATNRFCRQYLEAKRAFCYILTFFTQPLVCKSNVTILNPDTCCEYAALRLLFAHLCNHSAAEGVRLTRDLPDGLTQGRQGKVSMSIYDEAGPPVSYVEEQAVLPSIT
jgi:hypothetical protein